MVSGGVDKLLKTIFCCREKNILTFPAAELLYISGGEQLYRKF